MKVSVIIYVILSLNLYVEAYKFLLVYHIPGRSVNQLGEQFMKFLINAGHEVTFITIFPTKIKNERLREIDISDNYKSFKETDLLKINYLMENKLENDLSLLQHLIFVTALSVLNHENVKKLIEDPNEKFDAVIADLNEFELYAAFSALYDCPMIWTYSMGPHWNVLRLIDRTTNPAYSPFYLSPNDLPLSFTERVEELWNQIKWNYNKWWTMMPLEIHHYKEIFGPLLAKRGRALPPYHDLIYNASLIFSNSIEALGDVPATPANFKMVGGYHIDPTPKPLSQDLQAVMDNSTHGVIYFSMGSMFHSKFIPESVTDGLIKMFGELKQTVIWKYEEDLPNLPDNLHILKWAPQTSILAHPKCLFFITHAGLLSSTEAIHFGVPVIGVPIYYDQFFNINRAVNKGYALKVDLTYELVKNLKIAINAMLKDQKYKQKVKELSKIYHDRPMPLGEEMVYWTEHVVRTRGAPHLRSPALHMPVYQQYYLDLAAVITAMLVIIHLAIRTLLKKLRTHKKKNSGEKSLESNAKVKKRN